MHCNLTQINNMAFVKDDNTFDFDDMERALELATYMAYIISMQELDLYEWNEMAQNERVIGVSMNGIQDAFNKTNSNRNERVELMNFARKVVHNFGKEFSKKYQIKEAKLSTTQQPAGNSAAMLDSVSSGVHFSHSEYYIRRMRINKDDPVAKSLVESGFDWKPEVGESIENHSTKVFEFPVKSPKGKTKYSVSAIEQLEMYKDMMLNYVDHNTSITVSVRDDEWDDVEQWVYDNWDIYVGISFLSLDDSFYDLLPYESISKEEYDTMLNKIPKFNPDKMIEFETGEDLDIADESGCESGICPIR